MKYYIKTNKNNTIQRSGFLKLSYWHFLSAWLQKVFDKSSIAIYLYFPYSYQPIV